MNLEPAARFSGRASRSGRPVRARRPGDHHRPACCRAGTYAGHAVSRCHLDRAASKQLGDPLPVRIRHGRCRPGIPAADAHRDGNPARGGPPGGALRRVPTRRSDATAGERRRLCRSLRRGRDRRYGRHRHLPAAAAARRESRGHRFPLLPIHSHPYHRGVHRCAARGAHRRSGVLTAAGTDIPLGASRKTTPAPPGPLATTSAGPLSWPEPEPISAACT
jgi:hypothetical protein